MTAVKGEQGEVNSSDTRATVSTTATDEGGCTEKTSAEKKVADMRTEVSKKVSWIVRHGIHTVKGAEMDEEGYIRVDALWKTPGLDQLEFSLLLEQIHASNEQKRRYDLKEGDGIMWIRATKEKQVKKEKEKERRDDERSKPGDTFPARRAEDDRPPKGRGKQSNHRPPPDRSSWGQKPKDVSQIGKHWVVANNVGEVIVREGISIDSAEKCRIDAGQLVTQVGADEEIQETGIIRMEISFQLGEESCSGWVTKTAESVNGPRYFYPPRQRESTISGIHTNGHGKGRWERTTTNTSLDRTDMVHHVEHEARISYTAPSTGPSTPSGTLLEKFGQDYPFWTQQSPSPEHLEDKSVCVSGEPWRSKRVDAVKEKGGS